jgi:hypothetical protein
MHRTLIFFLPESGAPQAVAQEEYVRLLRHEAARPEFAGQTLRVADWYVRVEAPHPPRIQNETYSFLRFNHAGEAEEVVAAGNVKPSSFGTPRITARWQPSQQELAMLDRIVFSDGSTSGV